jgi:hypothetical protein
MVLMRAIAWRTSISGGIARNCASTQQQSSNP